MTQDNENITNSILIIGTPIHDVVYFKFTTNLLLLGFYGFVDVKSNTIAFLFPKLTEHVFYILKYTI